MSGAARLLSPSDAVVIASEVPISCYEPSVRLGASERWDDSRTGNILLRKAGEGELIVRLPRNELLLRFERSGEGAQDTVATRKRFNEAFDIAGSEPERRGNVVFLWDNTPRLEERALFDGCLRE